MGKGVRVFFDTQTSLSLSMCILGITNFHLVLADVFRPARDSVVNDPTSWIC